LEQKRIEKIEAYPKRSVEIFSIRLCPRDCGRLPVSISDFGLKRVSSGGKGASRPLSLPSRCHAETVFALAQIGVTGSVRLPERESDAQGLNPKSEIQTGKMTQDLGAETNRKKSRHTRSGLSRFFQFVYAQEIAADCRFEFRISGQNNCLTPGWPRWTRGRTTWPAAAPATSAKPPT
jgi:hypothetical protein